MSTSGYEQDISNLMDRVSKLEASATYSATQSEVQLVQMELLEKLRHIRDVMVTESGGCTSASSAELENLRAENASLKLQLEKKNYRILHLVQSVKDLTGKPSTS